MYIVIVTYIYYNVRVRLGSYSPSNTNYIFVGHKYARSSTRNPPAIFKYYIILYIGTYKEISLPIFILPLKSTYV